MLAELAEFQCNELETRSSCGTLINAYSEENCTVSKVIREVLPNAKLRPFSEYQSVSRKMKYIVLFLVFFSCFFFFLVILLHRKCSCLHVRFSASLSGRKPRAFGSYMKYEGKSRWMRIVRLCVPLKPVPVTMGSDLGSVVL